jgi:hypothetical protein
MGRSYSKLKHIKSFRLTVKLSASNKTLLVLEDTSIKREARVSFTGIRRAGNETLKGLLSIHFPETMRTLVYTASIAGDSE